MADDRDHDHDHDHANPLHNHPPLQPDDESPPGRHEVMTEAMRELLVEKGVLSADDIRAALENIDSWAPSKGAQIVARAWTDDAFRKRLLADGNAALAEFGIDSGGAKVTVVENTDRVHNVIVCTLCSCYPRAVLGLPPDWYRSKNYRRRVVVEPRAVLEEFGLRVPDDRAVRVHDSLADLRYLVLPRRPEGTDGWTEEQLAGIVTRDCMVGVAEPRPE
ncbi:MAG: nitrile hydratase subunit alpha [Alphaproteobacteria bacterium]|nr:nitrile hydratase subunit alpha [Alphaproteobacteria bacterium]